MIGPIGRSTFCGFIEIDLHKLKVIVGEDSTGRRIKHVDDVAALDRPTRILLDADPDHHGLGESADRASSRRSAAISASNFQAFGGNYLISGTRVLRAKGVVKIDVPRRLPGLLTIRVRSSSETPRGRYTRSTRATSCASPAATTSAAPPTTTSVDGGGDGPRTQPPPTGAAAHMGMETVAVPRLPSVCGV